MRTYQLLLGLPLIGLQGAAAAVVADGQTVVCRAYDDDDKLHAYSDLYFVADGEAKVNLSEAWRYSTKRAGVAQEWNGCQEFSVDEAIALAARIRENDPQAQHVVVDQVLVARFNTYSPLRRVVDLSETGRPSLRAFSSKAPALSTGASRPLPTPANLPAPRMPAAKLDKTPDTDGGRQRGDADTKSRAEMWWQCNASDAGSNVSYWSSIDAVDLPLRHTPAERAAVERRNQTGFIAYIQALGLGLPVPATATCWSSGSKESAKEQEESGLRFARQRNYRVQETAYFPQ